MKKIILLVIAMVVMTLSMATGASATEQSTALPANGVTSITQNGDNFTINLASADASEVKYIKPGNTVLCSEHEGKPKNGHPLCDKTSYTITSNADCVMFQVDWTDNKHNSSDPVKCRDKTEPPAEPPFKDYEVQACWKVDNWKVGDDDWPQTRVDCPIPDKATTCEDERYQFDKYWIRDKADEDKFNNLKTLENSGSDGSLEPHDYYVKTVPGDKTKCAPVDEEIPVPAMPQILDPCGPGNASWVVPADTDKINWEITNGPLGEKSLTATAKDGYTFPNKEKVKGFGNAPETNLDACPVVEPPVVVPPVVEPPVPTPPVVTPPPVLPPVTDNPPIVDEPEGEIGTPISERRDSTPASPVYDEPVYKALPNTGGPQAWYVLAGLALVAAGTTVVLRLSKK